MGTTCGNGETLVFTCAGAAHSGQASNRAGVKLATDGAGRLFCIAAVGAGIPDKMERATSASRRVAIDGCDDACCKRVLEKAGLPVDVHVIATDAGIEKQPAHPSLIEDAKRLAEQVRTKLADA